MKQFNESFYTDDFDQEMLDFIKTNYNVTISNNLTTDDKYLKHGMVNKYFWTHDNAPMPQVGFVYLTKNQFKEKIGMTNESQPDKKERIFKLIDKDGYVCSGGWNRQLLTDNGIFVDGFYYLKGVLSSIGDLLSLDDDSIIIEEENKEFQYFEEVDSIPLPKEKPSLDNYFITPDELKEEESSKQAAIFTKDMLVSGKHIVETCQGYRYLVAGEFLIGLSGYHLLSEFSDNLEVNNKDDSVFDIAKVYSGKSDRVSDNILAGQGFSSYLESGKLTLIWQRETPEDAQKRLEKEKLEEEVQSLKELLKVAENLLQEL